MSEAIHTSFKRYERVHEILKGDNALKRKLSTRMAAVCKPDRSFVDFPVEVVHVTDEIHKQGLDVATMTKLDVIRHGFRLLIQNSAQIPAPTATATALVTGGNGKTSAKVKVKASAKVKAEKPKLKPKPKPVKAAPKVQATAASRPAAVEPSPAGETKTSPPVASASKPITHVRPGTPYVVGVAALTLLESVNVLFQPYVTAGDPDAKEVCARANELIDFIHRRTVLPSAEKEPTTSAG